MARKSEGSFEEGDFVVYPTHVGRILGTKNVRLPALCLKCWWFGLSMIG